MKLKKLFLILLLLSLAKLNFAQQAPIKLYPQGVPNSKPGPGGYVETTVNVGERGESTRMVTDPVLIPFFPDKSIATGAAVVICPGGGYSRLAMGYEGFEVAKKFNEIGVAAFILKYRLPNDAIMPDKAIAPLQDAQRSMQIIRQRAAAWGIDTGKVGIIGFSAGGHLAATAGTHFDKAVIDNKDHVNLRPDFMMLIYAVIIEDEKSKNGTLKNLLGPNQKQADLDYYSNEKQVKDNTPVTFIVHAEDDHTVPVQGSLTFYSALVVNGIKAQMIIYPSGGHAFGLNNKTTKDHWFDSATNWLDVNGFLKK